MLDKLGKGIVLRETIALHSSIVLLLMPKIGYLYYPSSNPMSRLWVKFMPIEEPEYFSFVVPSVLLFNLVLCWPIFNRKGVDEGARFLRRWISIVTTLNDFHFDGAIFILVGTILYLLNGFLPVSLQYVGFISFLTAFTGFLMLYFRRRAKNRRALLVYFIVFLSYVTLESGMFTIVIYMGMTIFSFLFLGSTWGFLKKLSFFILVVFILTTLQSVKVLFRQITWREDFQDNKAALFGELFIDEINNKSDLVSPDKLFFFYVRANQGFNVASVMKHIPRVRPHDNGAYLAQTVISSFVPRALWPDKPKAGGKFTMQYYAGILLEGKTSMNVSPVGEAYGSFGAFWGIVYLMFLAFFIRWIYKSIFLLSNGIPFIVFWIPVLFFQVTYSMETDSLQIFNSLIKSIFFISCLYYFFPRLFGVTRKIKPTGWNIQNA